MPENIHHCLQTFELRLVSLDCHPAGATQAPPILRSHYQPPYDQSMRRIELTVPIVRKKEVSNRYSFRSFGWANAFRSPVAGQLADDKRRDSD